MSSKPYLVLFTFLFFTVVFLTCKGPFPTEDKPTAPTDHTESIKGALHKAGSKKPFKKGNDCYVFHCHHADLRGGWSRANQNQNPEIHIDTYGPSCYQCHVVNWDPQEPELLRILYPASFTKWQQGQSVFVEWIGQQGDSVSLHLFKGEVYLGVFYQRTASDGVLKGISLQDEWGRGNNFRLLLEDNNGKHIYSNAFAILSPNETIDVVYPLRETVWRHLQVGFVEWKNADGPSVQVYIFKGADSLGVFIENTENDGAASREIPESWGVGTTFRLKVVDQDKHFGFSQEFTIEQG